MQNVIRKPPFTSNVKRGEEPLAFFTFSLTRMRERTRKSHEKMCAAAPSGYKTAANSIRSLGRVCSRKPAISGETGGITNLWRYCRDRLHGEQSPIGQQEKERGCIKLDSSCKTSISPSDSFS